VKTYKLDKVGVEITVNKGSGRIVKGLDELNGSYGDAENRGAVDALESLILAHACAGIDVSSKKYQEGVVTALDAIDNNL